LAELGQHLVAGQGWERRPGCDGSPWLGYSGVEGDCLHGRLGEAVQLPNRADAPLQFGSQLPASAAQVRDPQVTPLGFLPSPPRQQLAQVGIIGHANPPARTTPSPYENRPVNRTRRLLFLRAGAVTPSVTARRGPPSACRRRSASGGGRCARP